ncbi:MAG: hypothetical protein H7Z43_10240, partial [Clostridia bacterium]|nr:hypothetical protein [Deltaproteobacteria bacterium]
MQGLVSPFFTAAINQNRSLFHELAVALGGTLHYLDPAAMQRNIMAMQTVASKHELPLSIAFARKANKALAFIDTAREAGIGV